MYVISTKKLWKYVENKFIPYLAEPRKEAYYFIKSFFHISEKDFIFDTHLKISKDTYKTFFNSLKERISRKPLAYIVQRKEFFSLEFYVDENVLIPRQETEELVEKVIQNLQEKNQIKGIDIGTGCGCIAISLFKYCNQISEMVAVDISKNALIVAKRNAKNLLESDKKIQFLLWDWIENSDYIKQYQNYFDFVVSNPPYVLKEEYKYLEKEVLYEPVESLIVEDPEYFFYIFFYHSHQVLKEGGTLFLETSPSLILKQKSIAEDIGFSQFQIIKDIQRLNRFLFMKK